MDEKKLPRAKVREDGKLEVEGDKYPFIQDKIRSLASTWRTLPTTAITKSTTARRRWAQSRTAVIQKGDAIEVAGMAGARAKEVPFSVRAVEGGHLIAKQQWSALALLNDRMVGVAFWEKSVGSEMHIFCHFQQSIHHVLYEEIMKKWPGRPWKRWTTKHLAIGRLSLKLSLNIWVKLCGNIENAAQF
jgi:hypothetical protein